MSNGEIRINELVDVPGAVSALSEINKILKDMIQNLDVDLRKGITVLNNIKVTNSDSLKKEAEALKEIERLTQERIKTKQVQKKVEEQEIKLKEKLAKASAEAKNVYKQESAQLNDLRNSYKNLAAQGRENGTVARALKEEIDKLDKKLKAIDTSVGQNTRHVGDYKGQLRDLLKEMQLLEPGSEAFIEAANKAGELKDKIKDAQEATADLASGSKIEQAGNVFSRIKEDVANVDFSGAAEKTKTFGKVLSSISFKEILGGLKSLGGAILNLGKVILTSPIGLMAAAIAGISYLIYDWVQATNAAEEAQKKLAEAIAKVNLELGDAYSRIDAAQRKLLVLTGKLTERQAEDLEIHNKHVADKQKLEEKYVKAKLELRKELGIEEKKVDEQGYINDVAQNKLEEQLMLRYNGKVREINEQFRSESLDLSQAHGTEIAELEEIRRQEDLKKARDKAKELLRIEMDYRKKLRDLITQNIQDDEQREQQELIDKFNDDKEKADKEINDKQLHDEYIKELAKKLKEDLIKIDQKYREQERKEQEDFEREGQQDFNKMIEAIRRREEDDRKLEIEKLQSRLEEKKKIVEAKGNEASEVEIREMENLIRQLFELRKKQLEAEMKIKLESAKNPAEVDEINKKYLNDLERLELEKTKILKDGNKARADQDREAQEKRLKELQDYAMKAFDLAAKEIQREMDLKQQALDKQISDRQKNIEVQQKLASEGKANELAFQKQELAKEQLQKEQLKKKEIKVQKEIAMLKLLAGYAEKDPSTALRKAAIDIALEGVIAAAFWEGSEHVGKSLGEPDLPGRDGYIVRVDGSERVMTGEQNRMVGNMSNEELAKLAYDYNHGTLLPNYAMGLEVGKSTADNMYNSLMVHQLNSLNKEVKQLQSIVANKRELNVNLDNLGNVIKTETEHGMQRVITVVNSRSRI